MKYSVVDKNGERPSSKKEICAIIRGHDLRPPIDLRLLDTEGIGATLTMQDGMVTLSTRWHP